MQLEFLPLTEFLTPTDIHTQFFKYVHTEHTYRNGDAALRSDRRSRCVIQADPTAGHVGVHGRKPLMLLPKNLHLLLLQSRRLHGSRQFFIQRLAMLLDSRVCLLRSAAKEKRLSTRQTKHVSMSSGFACMWQRVAEALRCGPSFFSDIHKWSTVLHCVLASRTHPIKRAGTSPVNAAVRETIMERQVHFQSSD